MKERFLKVYSNLPLALRSEIIYVLTDDKYKDEPMTWNACWLEVKNNTDVGKKILVDLDALKFI